MCMLVQKPSGFASVSSVGARGSCCRILTWNGDESNNWSSLKVLSRGRVLSAYVYVTRETRLQQWSFSFCPCFQLKVHRPQKSSYLEHVKITTSSEITMLSHSSKEWTARMRGKLQFITHNIAVSPHNRSRETSVCWRTIIEDEPLQQQHT